MNDKGVIEVSSQLAGKRIAFAVCGGIGAVESVKLIRELRRHGAEITAFLTPSATRFISELSVSWAAARPAVLEAGADVDHLDSFDWVVVAPLTLHTLAKSALGLTDNVVSLLIAGQLGRKAPLAFVPAMNLQLRNHPLYDTYRTQLQSWGVRFYPSEEEEGRFKMPVPSRFSEWLIEVSRER